MLSIYKTADDKLQHLDRQWEYRKTLMRDKRTIAAEVIAKLVKQSYCPGKPSRKHGYTVTNMNATYD